MVLGGRRRTSLLVPGEGVFTAGGDTTPFWPLSSALIWSLPWTRSLLPRMLMVTHQNDSGVKAGLIFRVRGSRGRSELRWHKEMGNLALRHGIIGSISDVSEVGFRELEGEIREDGSFLVE